MTFEGKLRMALIGDEACGKTALAVKFTQNLFIDYYCPTEHVEDFLGEIETRKGLCNLTILDTSSLSDEAVRALSYACSHVAIVCFDLTRAETLESVETHWVPELKKHCPDTPFIIAGCKRDEMCDDDEGCVCGGACCDFGEAELTELLSRTGATAYIDCSALTDENVEAVFGVAAECVNPRKRRNSARRLVASIKKKLSLL